jgi:hypothetical protein
VVKVAVGKVKGVGAEELNGISICYDRFADFIVQSDYQVLIRLAGLVRNRAHGPFTWAVVKSCQGKKPSVSQR